jgi:hypothetical protein
MNTSQCYGKKSQHFFIEKSVSRLSFEDEVFWIGDKNSVLTVTPGYSPTILLIVCNLYKTCCQQVLLLFCKCGGPLGTCVDSWDARFTRFDPEFRLISSRERIYFPCLKNKCFLHKRTVVLNSFLCRKQVNMKNVFRALLVKYLDAFVHEEIVCD